MAGLLTIETGFTCNSRCRYCTQLDYRDIPQADKLDLSTEEIKARIAFAGTNGYDQVGFSGGEPTIRPDFVELIAYAKQHGFKRIGVTTNGRMMAYRSFVEQAMEAGLDGFTFSLHGSEDAIHDRITNAKGALSQALAGLRNIAAVRDERGLEAHLMNNQIILPDNVDQIRAVVELLGPFGVKLFMIQPFITQRSNSDDLGRFFVPYDAIVANVERALPALERFGARVKPYNVPNCLLWRFGPRYVEPQFYGIRPFREYEQDAPGAFRAFKVKQWFRVPQCRDCKEMCPGFRIEQLPQQQMLDGVLAAAEAFVASADAADAADAAHAADVAQHAVGADALTPGDGDAADPRDRASGPRDGALIFSGTELFAAETLRATWAALAERHGAVDWMTGLCERSDRRTLARLLPEAAARGWLARVVLVGAPMDQRFFAQRVLEKGNLEELRAGLNLLGEAREAGRSMPRLRMLLNVGDAMRLLDDDAVSGQWGPLVRALHRAAGPDVVPELLLAVPNFPRGKRPPDMDRQFDATAAMAKRLRVAAELAHLRPALLTFGARRGLDPARAAAMALAERAFATELEVEDWSARLFRQPLSMPELDFVSWTPPWIFERFDVETQVADFAAEAADEGSAALRQGAVAPAGAS